MKDLSHISVVGIHRLIPVPKLAMGINAALYSDVRAQLEISQSLSQT
jgi:hypothetical protein